MREKILIVEDDRDLAFIVSDRLGLEGYSCDVCETGVAALNYLTHRLPDVVLCDLMLPDCPGEVVVRFVRSRSPSVPIVITSARTGPEDKVDLLGMGADDYLGKPFDLDELAARVAVQIRHSVSTLGPDARTVQVGPLRVDESSRTLRVRGEEVSLTRTEFNLLLVMARHPNRVYTRPELFEAVWGEPYADDADTVNVHVSNIRNKLRRFGADSCLATVWGVGFRLSCGKEGNA